MWSDLVAHTRFLMDMAWYEVKYDISHHLFLTIAAAGALLVLWFLLSPGLRKRG